MTHSSLGVRIEEGDLVPDGLVPVQFVELLQRPVERTPELRLMAAVLEEGVRTFCGCAGSSGRRSQRLFRESAEWFASSDASWPFAFENICEALALEPDWFRQLLRRWETSRTASASEPARVPSSRRLAGTRHAITGRAPVARRALRFAT